MAGTKKVYSYEKEHLHERLYEIVHNHRIESALELDEPDVCLLYHFSPLRENLVNWYPFCEEGIGLELGAECGAITEALSRRLKKLIVVENDEKNVKILKERFKDQPCVNVIQTEPERFEWQKKFDYIVIHKAFVCAEPQKLLETARELLKPQGKLLLAVDNRLGLKYFSGAADSYSGKYFESIRDYTGCDVKAGYSKSEICRLLEENYGKNYRFYYPYPDYCYPTEIYTDESIYEMGYGKFYFNVENDRFHFFDEPTVQKILREERLAENFSNSFLIEISKEAEPSKNVQYVKMNSDRRKEFRILTIIEEKDGEKCVTKKAALPEANQHIRNMDFNDHLLANEKISALKGELQEGRLLGVKYPFLKGETLDARFGTLVKSGNIKEAILFVKQIFDSMFPETERSTEYCTEEFQKVFGTVTSSESKICVRRANIDVILDNLFEQSGRFMAIDCEWVFEFLIPINFIKWRTTNELFIHYVQLNSLIAKEDFDRELGIGIEEGELYKNWAVHFIHEYIKGNLIERYVQPMIGGSLEMNFQKHLECVCLCSKLYVDYGEGFSEKHSYESQAMIKNGCFFCNYEIPEGEKVRRLRWDPVDDQCVRIRSLAITGEPQRNYEEILVEENGDLFMVTSDPKIYLEYPDGIKDVINISGEIEFVSNEQKNVYLKEIWEIHQRNRNILEILEWVYNTKIFRAMRKIFKILKNKGRV